MGVTKADGWWLLASLVGLSGCELYTLPLGDDGGDPEDEWQRVAVIDETPPRALDILLVIDDSGAMAEEQGSLIASVPFMVQVLSSIEGGLPDLHLAVVSTDVGAGPDEISGCSGSGDNGRFQGLAAGALCPPASGAFLTDIANFTGGRDRNYQGSLEENVSCLANLGTGGCTFGQPLESMRRALDGSNPQNAGFLRAEAQLLVVVMSDEDDCSARDVGVFDSAQSSRDAPLGPLTSFRCFEFGVACGSGNRDPRADGPRDACVPQEDSAFLYGVQPYVDFLRGLKRDPSQVSVAVIVGPAAPVSVGPDPAQPQNPALLPSCQSGAGRGLPAVRLGWFAAQFATNTVSSICDQDFSDALVSTANLPVSTAAPCLPAEVTSSLVDLDDRCRGFQVRGLDTVAEQRFELAMCAQSPGELPCLRFAADQRCAATPTGAAVVVERGWPPPDDALLVVECLP